MTLPQAKERGREKGKIERIIDSFDTRVQKVRDSLSEAIGIDINNLVF